MRKKCKEDEQTLEELNSALRRFQAKYQKLFLFLPYNNHLSLLAELVGRSVW